MALCGNCGQQLDQEDTRCPNCGRPVGRASPSGEPARSTDGTAIAALVFGVLGVPGCFVFSILAIVLGNQAQARIAANPGIGGEGLARAGSILGWVGLALAGAWILFALVGAVGFLPFIL